MNFLRRVFFLYYDGFRNMTLGRVLWKIILIKIIVLYGVLKFFVFDENLKSLYPSEEQKKDFIFHNLTKDTNG